MSRQQDLFEREPLPWELDEGAEQRVAEVVFAETPFGPYDYTVPEHLHAEVETGRRVRVPLGRGNRTVLGYVVEVATRATGSRRLKDISSVVDPTSLISPAMLRLCQWMADNYLCEWGQAIEAVVPAAVREKAGTREVTLLSVPTNVAARMTQLKLSKLQATALKTLAGSTRPLTPRELASAVGCTEGPITALRRKGLVSAEVQRVHLQRREEGVAPRASRHELHAEQQAAFDAILAALDAGRHETFLMHGVTGSGKTEVYIRAIEEVIRYGRQAIVLVPEISLTPQTRQRFRERFDRVAVLHSHLSGAERHWHWRQIAKGEVEVVVGARSAVFAPTPRLGLIVIDEEHDGSFKQDSVPRYHAREVALQRAREHNVPLVLGSATPSLESFHAARQGRYRMLELPGRVLGRPLPHVGAIDLRLEFKNRTSRGAVSRQLHQAINESLREGGQVILLLNRRGFSTSIQCPACGHVVKCPDCDIALTHHREGDKAVCHFCDFEITAPPVCPECDFVGIRYSGLGTQRLEAEIRGRFPNVPCLRMDSDTMQKPGSHEEALAQFREGKVKILLGTQMIAKGLDFPDVTLVGVINADTALHFPDFRAAERTFGLVTQVAGRTGRSEKGGRVLVQTFSPEHPALQAAMKHDYLLFARQELPLREQYGYPPYTSMIRLVVRGPLEATTEQFAERLCDELRSAAERQSLACRILGPAPAPISKLRGRFRFHTLLLASDAAALTALVRDNTRDLKPPDDVQWIADVDPLDML
ncbi:MAG: primosomal protein N' [Pirellulaceae bacterium]